MMDESVNPEPILITPKGEMNTVVWCAWYRAKTGCNVFKAQMVFNEKVQCMPEPELVTKSGKINKIWVKWYRMRKKVSSNVALAVAKRRQTAIAEGKKPLEEHLTAWW